MLIALTLASSLAYYSSWAISPFLYHEGWEDLRVFGVQLLHKSHSISAYWIFSWIIVDQREEGHLCYLWSLWVGVSVVSGCAVLRESLLLFTCQTLTKDVCHSHPDERTSRPWIRADSGLSKPRHSLFPAKLKRPEGVYYAKHVGHVNIFPLPSPTCCHLSSVWTLHQFVQECCCTSSSYTFGIEGSIQTPRTELSVHSSGAFSGLQMEVSLEGTDSSNSHPATKMRAFWESFAEPSSFSETEILSF